MPALDHPPLFDLQFLLEPGQAEALLDPDGAARGRQRQEQRAAGPRELVHRDELEIVESAQLLVSMSETLGRSPSSARAQESTGAKPSSCATAAGVPAGSRQRVASVSK